MASAPEVGTLAAEATEAVTESVATDAMSLLAQGREQLARAVEEAWQTAALDVHARLVAQSAQHSANVDQLVAAHAARLSTVEADRDGLAGELASTREELEITRRMLERATFLLGARSRRQSLMFGGSFSLSHVVHEWHRVASETHVERDKRFQAERLRRKMLLRTCLAAWATDSRQTRRARDKEEWERRVAEAADAATAAEHLHTLAAEERAIAASERESAAKADAAALRERVASLLRRGMEAVGQRAMDAIEAGLLAPQMDAKGDASSDATPVELEGSAAGLLRLMLEVQTRQAAPGSRKARPVSPASRVTAAVDAPVALRQTLPSSTAVAAASGRSLRGTSAQRIAPRRTVVSTASRRAARAKPAEEVHDTAEADVPLLERTAADCFPRSTPHVVDEVPTAAVGDNLETTTTSSVSVRASETAPSGMVRPIIDASVVLVHREARHMDALRASPGATTIVVATPSRVGPTGSPGSESSAVGTPAQISAGVMAMAAEYGFSDRSETSHRSTARMTSEVPVFRAMKSLMSSTSHESDAEALASVGGSDE